MNQCRAWTILLVLTGVLVLLGSPGQTAQSKKEDVAGKSFEDLKAKIPKIKIQDDFLLGKLKVELARRISPDQAKITFVHKKYGIFIFLRYFDGHWTTIRGEVFQAPSTDEKESNRLFQSILGALMRAIDKASGE